MDGVMQISKEDLRKRRRQILGILQGQSSSLSSRNCILEQDDIHLCVVLDGGSRVSTTLVKSQSILHPLFLK